MIKLPHSRLSPSAPQVGILRRGRYMKGKQVGKGEMVKVGDQVRNACHFGCHYWLLFYQS